MNTTVNPVVAAFTARHRDVKKTIPLKDFMPQRIFEMNNHPEVKALKRDQVLAGNVNNGLDFLAINTLDGAFVMFNNCRGEIVYYCEPPFAALASIARAGFKTSGVIKDVKMLNHILDIPDSYL